jgi:hypothetical protein
VADASWRVVETLRLTRTQFERWFVNRDVSLVIMEACREFGIAIPTGARIAQLERELATLARLSPSNFATRLIDHPGYQGPPRTDRRR